VPAIDGALHAAEWSDGVCVSSATSDMTMRFKYAGDSLYIAQAGNPTCGCPMPFEFDPNGNTMADGDEFAISVFDDPFATNGDRADLLLKNGKFVMGMVPAGIEVMCPPNQPTPIRYEWKIPLAALGISPGTPHTFRFAHVHASAHWPSGVVIDPASNASIDTASWGTVSSSTNWK
jgi:hypothetical protein